MGWEGKKQGEVAQGNDGWLGIVQVVTPLIFGSPLVRWKLVDLSSSHGGPANYKS